MKRPSPQQSTLPLISLVIALIWAGCIGDPDQILYCENERCPEGIENGGSPDAGDAGSDAPFEPDSADGEDDAHDTGDAQEPPLWRVPAGEKCVVTAREEVDKTDAPEVRLYHSIAAAFDDGCEKAFIAPNEPAPLRLEVNDAERLPLKIGAAASPAVFMIEGVADGTSQIKTPDYGLFEVSPDSTLTLKNLVFIPHTDQHASDASTASHIIDVQEGAEFEATNIHFKGVNSPTGSIFYLKAPALLENLTIKDSTESLSGLLLIDGEHFPRGEKVTLLNGTIENNSGLRQAAITMKNGAPLTLSKTDILDNQSAPDIFAISGAAIHCENSTLTLEKNSQIAQNKLSPSISTSWESNITLQGTGLSLFDCDTTIRRSSISENKIAPRFDADSSIILHEIQLGGAGIYQNGGSLIIRDSHLADNQIILNLTTEDPITTKDISLYGGAISSVAPTELSLFRTTLVENITSFHESSWDTTEGLSAFGAGLYIRTQSPNIVLDQTTISKNVITLNSRPELVELSTAAGAGIYFFDRQNARLDMVNSTISLNKIQGFNNANGAGIFLESQGFDDPTDCSNIINWFECVFSPSEPPPTHLASALRYSTIAFNTVITPNDELTPTGGIYINKTIRARDHGPIVSFVGLLLHNPDSSDCGGTASLFVKDDELTHDDGDPDWGSASNFHLGQHKEDCKTAFGSEDGSNAVSFEALDTQLQEDMSTTLNGASHPPLHLPANPRGGFSELSPCTGLLEPLYVDQRGQPRPVENDRCYSGSVQDPASDDTP